MTTKKKFSKGHAILPKRTKEFVPAGNRKIPVYALPAKTIINPKKYVVVTGGEKSGFRELRVLRVADLASKLLENTQLSPVSRIGNSLIDTFSPRYGQGLPPTYGRFLFVESVVGVTFLSGWFMLANDLPDGVPHLAFQVDCEGLNLNLFVMTVHIVQAAGAGVLTVTVGAQEINLDTSNLGFQSSFDVVVRRGPTRWEDFRFEFGKQQKDDDSNISIFIEKFEMFQTIFAYPTETLEA